MKLLRGHAGRVETEYIDASLKVSTVSFARGTAEVRGRAHTIALAQDNVVTRMAWEGTEFAKRQWGRGELAFFPAGGLLKSRAESRGKVALFSVAPAVFVEAAMDHIDHSLIDFRLAEITGPTTAHLVATLRHITMAPGFTGWPLLVETTLLALAVATIRKLSPAATVAFRDIGPGMSVARKHRVRDYIHANLHRQITLAELADVAAMSQFHFARQFKKATGATPLAYIAKLRVDQAKKMLRSTSKPLAQVAADCGYSSQAHMTTVFKVATGTTPARYRRGVLGALVSWWCSTQLAFLVDACLVSWLLGDHLACSIPALTSSLA